ncbi:putative arginine N-methyltransferase [Cryptosporidium canis]|uniref:Arginine N-methyltransferase n=1 Tax=Cryptosporidium canis TaxID=195482 RepID=A0ABQ8P3B5_9CRYT|nr:putative arginine N-methyltransferase [Cryptosporidium canis]KAJ1611627.1 putative arginine N-methyltransferase [Cryptosporidium canis]
MSGRIPKDDVFVVINSSISSDEDERASDDEVEMLEYNSYLQEFDSLSEAKCLFCETISGITEEIWSHMKTEHEFDFTKETRGRDEYGQMRLINYLRRCAKEGLDAKREYESVKEDSPIWEDDSLLVPVISDDRLILELDTLNEDSAKANDGDSNVISEITLEEENKLLKKKIMYMADVISELQNRESELELVRDPYPSPCSVISTASEQGESDIVAQKESSITRLELPEKVLEKIKYKLNSEKLENIDSRNSQAKCEDTPYFSSYSTLDIHREMILDKVRTDAYYNFITDTGNSCHFFKDKVVLDVGTGTGILSLFAVQSGAKMVVAVDAAKNTIRVAESIARTNGFDDRIQFVCGKLEDLDLFMVGDQVVSVPKRESPPKDSIPFKCDVIISEWMGYCLLYESMLYTILNARDRYLKAENGGFSGDIFPSSVRLQVAIADYSDQVDSLVSPWINDKLYNLDLSEISPKLSSVLSTPYVEVVPSERLRCTGVSDLPSLSILNLTNQELSSLRQPFSIEPSQEHSFFTSLIVSFNAEFDSPFKRVVMETSPFHEPTHWKQTILHIKSPDDKLVKVVGGVSGYITITPRMDNSRHISILVELYNVKTLDNQVYPQLINHYAMN